LVLVAELWYLHHVLVEDVFSSLGVLRLNDVVRSLDCVLFIGESQPIGIGISARYAL
jgi:hypothetical protein